VEGVQAGGDGREMRARVVIPATVLAMLVPVLVGPGRAWAVDTGGVNTFANAHASGGQLTVQAGETHWTPPAGSSWAKAGGQRPAVGQGEPEPALRLHLYRIFGNKRQSGIKIDQESVSR